MQRKSAHFYRQLYGSRELTRSDGLQSQFQGSGDGIISPLHYNVTTESLITPAVAQGHVFAPFPTVHFNPCVTFLHYVFVQVLPPIPEFLIQNSLTLLGL